MNPQEHEDDEDEDPRIKRMRLGAKADLGPDGKPDMEAIRQNNERKMKMVFAHIDATTQEEADTISSFVITGRKAGSFFLPVYLCLLGAFKACWGTPTCT